MDVILPVCNRFLDRVEDFKKYGLLNQGSRKVRVNLVVSGEKVKGLEEGWRGDFTVRVVENESSEYVANLYRFYLSVNPSDPGCRWLVRLDDDSCTDVDGLITNLDRFYGSDGNFYLGDLHPLQNALNGFEGGLYHEYKSLLGDYAPFSGLIKTEIECGVMSRGAMSKVLSNERSRRLIEKRSTLSGGYGDCVVALASALAGVYAIDCPFITHLPLLHEFSMLGGIRNHIHMISRTDQAENFTYRASPESFKLLTKVAESSPTEIEQRFFGTRILLESQDAIRIIQLNEGYTARVKLDDRKFNWYESDGEILVLEAGNVFNRIKVGEDSLLSSEGFSVSVL